MTEDYALFFADWGIDATIGTTTISVIMDEEYQEVEIGGVGKEARTLVVTTPTVTLPSETIEGATITINSVAYTIRNPRPDGTGITTMDLSR